MGRTAAGPSVTSGGASDPIGNALPGPAMYSGRLRLLRRRRRAIDAPTGDRCDRHAHPVSSVAAPGPHGKAAHALKVVRLRHLFQPTGDHHTPAGVIKRVAVVDLEGDHRARRGGVELGPLFVPKDWFAAV